MRKEAFEVFQCFSRSEAKSEKISIFFEKSVKIEKKLNFFGLDRLRMLLNALKCKKLAKLTSSSRYTPSRILKLQKMQKKSKTNSSDFFLWSKMVEKRKNPIMFFNSCIMSVGLNIQNVVTTD